MPAAAAALPPSAAALAAAASAVADGVLVARRPHSARDVYAIVSEAELRDDGLCGKLDTTGIALPTPLLRAPRCFVPIGVATSVSKRTAKCSYVLASVSPSVRLSVCLSARCARVIPLV